MLQENYKKDALKRADRFKEDPDHLQDLQIESFGGY